MGADFKTICRNAAEYARTDKKSLRKLLISMVSLIVASVIFVSMSFSWFTRKGTETEIAQFTLDCGKGLRVNDTGTSTFSFSQDQQRYITPASSVDGRNLYFPTDGSDFSSITENMTFRSANAGDKNQNYIQIDFTLTAQQNHTALYINDEKTNIKVKDTSNENGTFSVAQASSLRSALWCSTAESGLPNVPIVFNPTSGTIRTAAVAEIDRSSGAYLAGGRQVAHPFSDYAFGGSPVATLSKNVETKFSYIVWLEGTDPKCTEKIRSKDIQIELAFTTSWDKTQTIRFEDRINNGGTTGTWVKNKIDNDGYSLSLHYVELDDQGVETERVTDFNMWKYNDNIDNVWSCNIPGDMRKNISFILRPNDQSLPTYKFTKSSKVQNADTYDRGSNRLYVAELIDTTNTDQCKGYWMAVGDSDGAGHDSGDVDGDDF